MERGLRGNADRLERLQAVTDAALAHLEVEELLRVLLPRIRDILAADTCAVLLLDEGTDELVARAAVGIEEEVEAGVRIPVGGGFAGRVAAGRSPVVLDDIDEAEVLNPILREKGIKSMLGVPLLVAGAVIGVLHVGTLHRRQFDADDVDLLQLAADRAAVAIEHARLFEAERRARRRIEHVQAVTDAALAHLELQELLDVLLPRIRDILAADTCAVLLLDRGTNELVARAALGRFAYSFAHALQRKASIVVARFRRINSTLRRARSFFRRRPIKRGGGSRSLTSDLRPLTSEH